MTVRIEMTLHDVIAVRDEKDQETLGYEFDAEPPEPHSEIKFIQWPVGKWGHAGGQAEVTWVTKLANPTRDWTP